jgi:glycoside/pentoside/hexuronide:cation symporter, GPH family
VSTPSAARAAPADNLSLPLVLSFVSATIPAAILLGMLGVFLPRYFATLGLSLFAVGGTISLVRLFDTFAVDLPLGWMMDKTATPIGRYKPWYIAGAPILMLGVYMLFNPPKPMSASYLFIWYVVLWIGLSTMTIAHSAWAANLATSYNQRSRLFGWMIPVGVLGGIGLNLLPLFTHGKIGPGKFASIPLIGWGIIGIGLVTTAIVALAVREPVSANIQRGKIVWSDYWSLVTKPTALRLILGDLFLVLGPGLTGPIYIFFFNQAKGFSVGGATVLLTFYAGAGLIWAPLWSIIARRIGKHRTLQIACLCYAICQTSLMALPKGLFLPTAIGMFMVGGCASAFLFLVRAMLADFGDELRLEQGVTRVSLLYSFVGMTQKVGSSLNTTISFAVLQMVGFKAAEGAVNTPHAIFGLEMVYLFAPIAFVVVGGSFFFGYKLDATRHAEIRTALDERDAAIEAEALSDALTGDQTMSPATAAE